MEALKKVKGIEKTLLVVSHDSLQKEMLQLVGDIDFCQVKQIIHPSTPLHKPDASALKEHWWWLQHTLWTRLFPHYQGDVYIVNYFSDLK